MHVALVAALECLHAAQIKQFMSFVGDYTVSGFNFPENPRSEHKGLSIIAGVARSRQSMVVRDVCCLSGAYKVVKQGHTLHTTAGHISMTGSSHELAGSSMMGGPRTSAS